MKRTWLLFSIAAMISVASVGSAQNFGPSGPPTPKIDSQANQEDIEVMRRLLNQLMLPHRESRLSSLAPFLYQPNDLNTLLRPTNQATPQNQAVAKGLQWLATYSQLNTANAGPYDSVWADVDSDGWPDIYVTNSAHPAPKITFEGNYLKGHGISFTATVAPTEPIWFHPGSKALGVATCATCHGKPMTSAAPPQPAPLSAWEKTRLQVIGTPPPKARPAVRIGQTCQPGNLTEAILDLLAENGHHFGQLPSNENLSVALTIRTNQPLTAAQETTDPNRPSKTLLSKVQDLKTLGELHLKQKKWNDAADTFRDAIKIMQHVPASKNDGDAKNFDREKEMRYLNLKLIFALTSAGRDTEAEAWVKKLAEGPSKVPAPEAKAKPEPVQKPILPGKLIITVSKQLLMDVHSKKITLEQFKKSAEIEAIGFPAADKKK